MADFSIASQIKPVQLPDQLQQYAQFNQLALHQAQLAEVQRAANEQNQMRALLGSGIDRSSPEAIRQAYNISMGAGKTLETSQSELRNAELTRRKTEGEIAAQGPALQKARTEAMLEDAKHYRSQLNSALANPDDATAAAVYNSVLADVRRAHPEIATKWPERFDRATITSLMQTPEQTVQAQAAARLAAQSRTTVVTGPNGVPLNFDKTTNTYVVGQPAPPPAAGAQPFAAPANTPAAVRQQPTAVGAPAIGDAYSRNLDAAEGRNKNSRSTAQEFGQFLNGTFVDTAKKVFPELANKSPAEILTLRGTKLADGTPIEAALEQKFRTDNIASLASAGIQPTPGNVYLAHFLGAGGARNVLSADPNTPLSQVVSADAIKANPEVLAIRNKTVGDLQNWANSKFGNEPGLAASMTASNARLGGAPAGFVPAGGAPMSPGAPTVNNALMANMMAGQAAPANMLAAPAPPQLAAPAAMPVAQTTAPVLPPATTIEELNARAAAAKLTEKGAEERQKIQINKDASDAEKVVIREGFDKVWANMISQFKKLGADQMLIVPGETSLGNRAKAIGSTLSPTLTTLVAPERATPVTTLSNLRQTMLSALMGATGLTAQNLNSNKEMSTYLDSLSNPGQTVDSIVDTLNNLSERFGTGKKITVKDLTGGKAQNPQADTASARQRSGGAAPAAASVGNAPPTKAPAGVSQDEWDVMTPQERALF